MDVTVVGSGYVGLVAGACLAETGNVVRCVDVDAEKVERLRRNDIPIYEPGLEALVEANQAAGRLTEGTRVLDVGLHGTWLDSEAGGTREHSAGVDVGISAARNVWISVGYNFDGFRDEHFDASRYTADGPYVRFRMKLDQDTFKDLDLSRLRPGG